MCSKKMKIFNSKSLKNGGKMRDNDLLKEMWSNTPKTVHAMVFKCELLWQNSQLHVNNDVFYIICDLYFFLWKHITKEPVKISLRKFLCIWFIGLPTSLYKWPLTSKVIKWSKKLLKIWHFDEKIKLFRHANWTLLTHEVVHI